MIFCHFPQRFRGKLLEVLVVGGRQAAAHGGGGHREEEQVRDDGRGTGGQVQQGAVAQDVQPGGQQINDF